MAKNKIWNKKHSKPAVSNENLISFIIHTLHKVVTETWKHCLRNSNEPTAVIEHVLVLSPTIVFASQ